MPSNEKYTEKNSFKVIQPGKDINVFLPGEITLDPS